MKIFKNVITKKSFKLLKIDRICSSVGTVVNNCWYDSDHWCRPQIMCLPSFSTNTQLMAPHTPFCGTRHTFYGTRHSILWHQTPRFMAPDISFYGTRNSILWHQTPRFMAPDISFYGIRHSILWHQTLHFMAPDTPFCGTRHSIL